MDSYVKVRRFKVDLTSDNPVPIKAEDNSEIAAVLDKKINRYRRRLKRLQKTQIQVYEENQHLADYCQHLKEENEELNDIVKDLESTVEIRDKEILMLQSELDSGNLDPTEMNHLSVMNLENMLSKAKAKEEAIEVLRTSVMSGKSDIRDLAFRLTSAKNELESYNIKLNKLM